MFSFYSRTIPVLINELGSIASIVGLPLSLVALGFALLQLGKLRGETRAAKDAAEEARKLFQRDLTATEMARLRERIRGLSDLHRNGDRSTLLGQYPEVWEMLIRIRRRHPNLSDVQRGQIQSAIETVANMQRQLEEIDTDVIPSDIRTDFNVELIRLQSKLLADLEDELEKSETEE